MLKYSALALAIGYVADLCVGDPKWLYHPIRAIGGLIAFFEKKIRRIFPATAGGELAGGFFTVLLVLLCCGLFPAAILYIAFRLNTLLGIIAMSFMCYQLLAVRSLRDESMKVHTALCCGTTDDGRKAVSMIVGRDTKPLDEKGVVKAAVETVAENFSDGVIAPMFYMILAGPIAMYLYKAVNTMDSMLGYKNDRYLYFGRCAAKLDDVVNFIPSRLAALLLILVSAPCRLNAKNAWKIFRRDRYRHASPNSAQTEAAMAGALGVRLAGDAFYFGTLCKKEYIGDELREIERDDIARANKLMYAGSFAAVVLLCVLHAAVLALCGLI